MKDPLAIRIRLGDEQAFELLFRKYFVRLCVFVNKFLNNPEESREIVQEVFMRLWEGREDLDPERSVKGYIFMIAQNMSLNRLRRLKLASQYADICKLVYLEHGNEFSTYETILAKELEGNIASAIEKLPPQCKKIFKYSRVEGLKNKEIADILNISLKTVETQMSKALRYLREEISDNPALSLLVCFLLFEKFK